VVVVYFQNSEYVEAFKASFFKLISLYLVKILCFVGIWEIEEIGDSIVSSKYVNGVVGIPVKTMVRCSCESFSFEDSYSIVIT